MKSRVLIWLSALALLVLIAMQAIFVTDTYITKQKQFDMHFGDLVREGLSVFNSQDFIYGIDSLLFLLDKEALEYLYAKNDTLLPSPGEKFHEILSSYKVPSVFLLEFLQEKGENTEFSYHLQLNELHLIDMAIEKQVYPDSVYLSLAPAHALLAGSYTHQRNFFKVSYEVYIDFQDRMKMILNEMWAIMILSALTLILIFSVFVITLRSMLRQKRLSEMKTDFINNMTHELKTPLSTISVASSSLGNPAIVKKSEKVEELSGIIKKQNRHLTQLIERILDINIWERDQVRIRAEEVKVESWIGELASAFLLHHQDTDVEIDISVDFPRRHVKMDEVHMSTAINNLLSNSFRYGHPPCRIQIDVSENEKNLKICVSDNGPGIRKEEIKHIFEKFYRGKESKDRVIKGLGLGLYYVKQIVEGHRGKILVESKLKGTVFTIQIPVDYGLTTG